MFWEEAERTLPHPRDELLGASSDELDDGISGRNCQSDRRKVYRRYEYVGEVGDYAA